MHALKVAYVYNFTKFIRWPETTSGEFQLCLNIKNRELESEFNKLRNKGLKVVSLKKEDIDQLETWQRCQIIYLDDPLMLARKPQSTELPTLTISESMNDDAQIHFIVIDNKLRFSIGKSLAEKAGLSISSKLLRLAHEVY